MPDVLVFGATGYTGQLTTRALAARGADFVVAGRDRTRLEELAAATGASGVAVARVGDVDALAEAAAGVRVLLSCVGPFTTLGGTAAQAALRAKVNYLDSSGEGAFIAGLIERCDAPARAAGIAMAPAMGFDEVPADVAATTATEGFAGTDLVLTYAVAAQASWGTIRSAIDVMSTEGRWIQEGKPRGVRAGDEERWVPMPPPLGPSRGVSFPLAEGHLAPLHLELGSLKLFVVAGGPARLGLRVLGPAWRAARSIPGMADLVAGALGRPKGGPDQTHRSSAAWTILAEATAGTRTRNVVMRGRDLYGLTAELLATGAIAMADPGYEPTGVLAPVEAVPVERWRQELVRNGVSIEVFGSDQ
jgi:short subunit dehydrogenase-like uncharacterized protein